MNTAEPCVLGNTSISVERGLISSIALPSALVFSLTVIDLNISYSIDSRTNLTLVINSVNSSLSISLFSSVYFSTTSSFTLSIASYLANFSLILIAASNLSAARS